VVSMALLRAVLILPSSTYRFVHTSLVEAQRRRPLTDDESVLLQELVVVLATGSNNTQLPQTKLEQSILQHLQDIKATLNETTKPETQPTDTIYTNGMSVLEASLIMQVSVRTVQLRCHLWEQDGSARKVSGKWVINRSRVSSPHGDASSRRSHS
jgi:hypothetical protein